MGLKVGNDMVFSYNSATDASPTWVTINMIGDLTVNLSVGEAEVDLRVSNWLLNLPAKLSGSFDFAMANDIAGTVYDALRGFAFGRTQKQFLSTNADPAGVAEGFKAFGFFSEFPWAQPTQEMSNHDASVSLGYTEEAGSLVEPSWETFT